MGDFLIALQFLTAIPVKINNFSEKRLANSLIYFPVTGLFIGLILSGINNLLFALNFYELAAAVFVVTALAALTAGLHLDGLSDTFDALASNKSKEKMLEIMRDSAAGAIGVVSIVCVLLLKITLICSIRFSDRFIALILMCVLSRWSMVEAMFSFPYARSEGKAKMFISGLTFKIFLISTAAALLIAVIFWQFKGVLIFAAAAIFSWLISKLFSNKFGGITGDTLGALNELMEIIILVVICLMERM